MVWDFVVAGVMVACLFVGLHYFPWRRVVEPGACKQYILPPPWSYICGELGLGLIYSGLIITWWWRGVLISPLTALIGFWIIVATGGGAVLACYALDGHLEAKAKSHDEMVRQEVEERHRNV